VPDGGHRQDDAVAGRRVPAEHRHAGLGDPLVELDDVGQLGGAGKAQADDERLRLRSERSQVAEVYGRRLVSQVVPGRPFQPEVDALEERVLADDEVTPEDRALRVQAAREAALLELRQEPELTQL
jgi:hypothetical protein